MPFRLSTCATRSDTPTWFDSIQRLLVKTVMVEEHRIAYLDAGSGPTVILVHGLSGSMWHWEYQQTGLSAHYRVVTLDLLGSGLSDKPTILYTPEQLVDFFHKFMEALGIRYASLVGHSMGAGLVIGMALTHPDQIDRLILISGLPDRIRTKLASPLIRHALDPPVPTWLATLGNRFSGRGPTRTFLHELVHDHSLLTPVVIERSYRNRRRPGIMRPLFALGKNLPLWEEGFARQLSHIHHQTHIIWGAEDRVFPSRVGQELHEAIPDSSFSLIADAGHIPQWERPEAVNPILVKFLALKPIF